MSEISKQNLYNFDPKKFNDDFEADKENRKLKAKEEDLDRLKLLDMEPSNTRAYVPIQMQIANNKTSIYNLTINDLIIGMKKTIFSILYDLLTGDLNGAVSNKDGKLFYIGIIVLIVLFILLLVDSIFE